MTKKVEKIETLGRGSSLVNAITCENSDSATKAAAKLIVERAMDLVYGSNNNWNRKVAWTNKDFDTMVALIQDVGPRDATEIMLASQFVALHLKGMATMQEGSPDLKAQAMVMLRLSQETLEMLQKYRGKSQTINVNYNMLLGGDTVLNTIIQGGLSQKTGAIP